MQPSTKPYVVTPRQQERFWKRVQKGDGCWNWTGNKIKGGYGHVMVGKTFRRNGKAALLLRLAHRVAYELTNGPIPEGMTIDHICGNPPCVKPDHLQVMSMRDNIMKGNAPPARCARQTHCLRGHPLTGSNLYNSHRPGRSCKACDRIRSRQEATDENYDIIRPARTNPLRTGA